ncbi:hypothetical protein GobsT_12220 [Gemmata obscuriglobus]|uniref:Uncharacterized protein n=1 Tax=Gemmata obscuriglobus TaxID=114 RepID=A0A2Z3H0L2_9BACT|nr:hypothetical protein [Gemmata obscuriglobus]AWM40309.1 hypothetical protein C1280_27100 [Gemmata obscuriglobus]QEG26482.1 hypothetical protein GobsT_12220 [Gemmata obscuriglobus]VTS01735.1 unnamed protein product [Gemmata obscuriglobus UQM 2246]
MPDNFISGNNSYVKLGAVAFSFNKWRLPLDGGVKKFFAFGHNFQRTLPGGVAGAPVCEGPYNAGNMPLALGALVVLHLGFAAGVELAVNARVSTIEYSSEISAGGDPAQCSVGFETDGEFTINFT